MGRATQRPRENAFEFSGGALCLDFVNTLGDRPRCTNEGLESVTDLIRWSAQAGWVSPSEARVLRAEARRRPREAARSLGAALELREALYRLFADRAADRDFPKTALGHLNGTLRQALPHLAIEREGDRFDWSWKGGIRRLDRLVWPVARSAAALLTSPELADLRECDSETCSWLFLDRSRNRRRRWCDMKTCGNRAKARRHYRRRRPEKVESRDRSRSFQE